MNRATRHLLAVLGILVGSPVLLPSQALAKDAVVSPLVSKGVDPLVVLNLTSLISSELDFMASFENVDQLDAMPAGMNGACLASPSCLGNVAKASGSPVVVAGAVAEVGKKLDLYLVLYDSGHIVRSKDFTLPNIPSVIADSMGAYVKELVTGKSAAKIAADAELDAFDGVATSDLFDDEDDVAIDMGGSSRRIPVPGTSDDSELDDFDMFEDEQASRQQAEEDARRQREDAARRQAEEDARRQREAEARRQAEEDARRQREAEARRQAEEDARRQREEDARAAAAAEDDDDFEDIQFGSAVADIQVEEVSFASAADAIVVDDSDEDAEDDFSFGLDDTADSVPAPRASRYDSLDDDSSSSSSSRRSSRSDDRSSRYDSLDDDSSSSSSRRSSRDDDRSRRSSLDDERSSRSSRDSQARVRSSSSSDTSALVVGRVGYSKFQDLAFVTYGAEATFMAMENLGIVAGVEAYSTRRAVPEALRPDETAPTTVWNTILPFNVGLQYKMSGDTVRPYLGGDIQFIPGYVKDQGGLATGFRARGGSDFMVADNFGFNLNLSAGYWSGQNFDSVQRDFGTSALVPQISGGTVVAF